jgi:saccharopine dehydrogenase (NADP+, L-glutamate forming)
MDKLLIIGAGRAASSLISYSLKAAEENDWEVIVADYDHQLAKEKVGDAPNGKAVQLDITDIDQRRALLKEADVVASMLPANLHMEVARDCIHFEKHLITASYVSPEMQKLSEEAHEKNLIFMGEIGLDPGLDHMSAMKVIHEIRAKGGYIDAFRSYTGGLVAPESDDNPWHYKFTWNPRNVILAGQGTSQYIERGKLKYIPYHRLFSHYDMVDIKGMGEYEMYANRDSLMYRKAYELEDIPTLLRGTLRHKGFCDAWNAFVKIGLTDDSYPIVHSGQITYRQLLGAYVSENGDLSLEEKIANIIGEEVDSEVMRKMKWTGIFNNEKIGLKNATPAQILEHLLLQKWKLEPDDKDMIIMQHEFNYEMSGEKRQRTSTMVLKGENSVNTAMSRLVGLPLGIFLKLVMKGKIATHGVNIPVMKEVYDPVLQELEEMGIRFEEEDVHLEEEK